MRESNSIFYLFLITSTRTTEIVQSNRTTSQTQTNEKSYAIEEEEVYHDGDMIDRIIADNYRILSKLGAGSFGQVYRCENIHTHEQWAIKIELNTANTNPILAAEVNTIEIFFILFVLKLFID